MDGGGGPGGSGARAGGGAGARRAWARTRLAQCPGRVAALAQLALREQGGADVPLGQRVGECYPAQLLQPGHELGRALVEDVAPGGDHLGEAVLGQEIVDGGLVRSLDAGDGGLGQAKREPLGDPQGGAVAVGVAALPAHGDQARAHEPVLRLAGARKGGRGVAAAGVAEIMGGL